MEWREDAVDVRMESRILLLDCPARFEIVHTVYVRSPLSWRYYKGSAHSPGTFLRLVGASFKRASSSPPLIDLAGSGDSLWWVR